MHDVEKVVNELYKDTSGYYKTLIVDSITELQQLDMREVMKSEYNKKPDSVEVDAPTQRAWGISGNRVRAIIRALRDLPMNTITTALLAQEQLDTGGNKVYPMLPGKLRGDVPGFFDIVGYLKSTAQKSGQEVSIERQLQLVSTERVTAKDRTGALGDMIKNPSIPLIWSMIHDEA